jgi:purine-binding chemotaxis protein CheW
MSDEGGALDRFAPILQRLGEISRSLTELDRITPERAAEILAERARALAQPPPEQQMVPDAREMIVFQVHGERLAIDMECVREVAKLEVFTPLPGAPPQIAGVTQHQGEILAVVDLAQYLGISKKGLAERSPILVLGRARAEFAILADEVHDARRVQIEDRMAAVTAPRAGPCVLGVSREGVILLDGGALLEDTELWKDGGASA